MRCLRSSQTPYEFIPHTHMAPRARYLCVWLDFWNRRIFPRPNFWPKSAAEVENFSIWKKIFPMVVFCSKAKKPFIWVPKNPQPGGFGRGRIFLHFPWVRTLLIPDRTFRNPSISFGFFRVFPTELFGTFRVFSVFPTEPFGTFRFFSVFPTELFGTLRLVSVFFGFPDRTFRNP